MTLPILPPAHKSQGPCHCGHSISKHRDEANECHFEKCDCPYFYPEKFWNKSPSIIWETTKKMRENISDLERVNRRIKSVNKLLKERGSRSRQKRQKNHLTPEGEVR